MARGVFRSQVGDKERYNAQKGLTPPPPEYTPMSATKSMVLI